MNRTKSLEWTNHVLRDVRKLEAKTLVLNDFNEKNTSAQAEKEESVEQDDERERKSFTKREKRVPICLDVPQASQLRQKFR